MLGVSGGWGLLWIPTSRWWLLRVAGSRWRLLGVSTDGGLLGVAGGRGLLGVAGGWGLLGVAGGRVTTSNGSTIVLLGQLRRVTSAGRSFRKKKATSQSTT